MKKIVILSLTAIIAVILSSCGQTRNISNTNKAQEISAIQKDLRKTSQLVLTLKRQLTTINNRIKLADSTKLVYEKMAEKLSDSLSIVEKRADSINSLVINFYGGKKNKMPANKSAWKSAGQFVQLSKASFGGGMNCSGGKCGGRQDRQKYMRQW